MRLPHRIVVSGVEFIPSVIRSRRPYTGRFRITDTRGYVVRDAIVLVTVRARKEGDNLLAGVSSRRLVRVRTAKPTS
ncbi:MAG TPA: hypothetical protein VFM13_07530 [Gaiellaceae bacterium]|nr:hypothetical protein [Gaiellaceae bacterium]